MASVLKKGPETIEVKGQKCPAWIMDSRGISDFNREAELDSNGSFPLNLLAPDECVLYPGAIYRLRPLAVVEPDSELAKAFTEI